MGAGRDVEVLVNNAGFGSAGRFQSLEGDKEALMVRTNCEAVVALCGRYIPQMIDRGRGAVLNLGSIAAYQPLPCQATYSATKAFVLTFTQALSADLHGTGVTATALCPGPVPTEFEQNEGSTPAGRASPTSCGMSAEGVRQKAVEGLDGGKRVVSRASSTGSAALGGQHVPRALLLRRGLHPGGK